MRLQHFLALAGVASRRHSEDLIRAGRVRVNGQPVTALGVKIDPERDAVEVDGTAVEFEKKVYVLLNKPRGCLSSVTDSRGRPTVTDLVTAVSARLYPVGRLDADTEGLLLLTNDGELCHRLTHPRYGIEKTYRAEVVGVPSNEALDALRQGVEIEDGKTSPAKVKVIESDRKHTRLEIVIHEGKKRQVKRMCAAVGHKVVSLRRVAFGGIRLGTLKPGTYRFLTDSEVAWLQQKADLHDQQKQLRYPETGPRPPPETE
jgi:pseudouridine synthase